MAKSFVERFTKKVNNKLVEYSNFKLFLCYLKFNSTLVNSVFLHFQVKGVETVIRQCAQRYDKKFNCFLTDGSSVQNICTCLGQTDSACNKAVKTYFSLLPFATILLFPFILI